MEQEIAHRPASLIYFTFKIMLHSGAVIGKAAKHIYYGDSFKKKFKKKF
jgi:hypothetical protein